MECSEQVTDLFKAMTKALSEIESLPLNKTNPHFKSKYADLAITIEKSKPALSSNGLMLIQAVENENSKYVIESMLIHTSGQWLKSRFELILSKNDMQGLGSAITYAKRYAAQSILFIAGDEDDDGNSAVEKDKDKKPVADKSKGPSPMAPASPQLIEEINVTAMEKDIPEKELTFLAVHGYGVEDGIIKNWIANEILAQLKKPYASVESIRNYAVEVMKRREAKTGQTK